MTGLNSSYNDWYVVFWRNWVAALSWPLRIFHASWIVICLMALINIGFALTAASSAARLIFNNVIFYWIKSRNNRKFIANSLCIFRQCNFINTLKITIFGREKICTFGGSPRKGLPLRPEANFFGTDFIQTNRLQELAKLAGACELKLRATTAKISEVIFSFYWYFR